jgi:hypothetical protein
MNKLIRLALTIVALAALPASAKATVIWSFYETSCTYSTDGPCTLPMQPTVIAELTLPGPTSTGTASWPGSGPPTLTGDADFTFTPAVSNPVAPPSYGISNISCGVGFFSPATICNYDISWSEVAGQLTA